MNARWLDTGESVEARVEALMGKMTLAEKCAQLGAVSARSLLDDSRSPSELLGERFPHGIGHVTRVCGGPGLEPAECARLINEIQRHLIERNGIGIPALAHEEAIGGLMAPGATVFPQAIGLASTWDPELVTAVARVIRDQMVAVGGRHALAPVLDIARDPRWGRVEETYGEDPTLVGALGTAYVRAMQEDLRSGVLCTGKHFVGHGASEGGMNHAPVHLGPRELREVHAEPFSATIRDAGLACVMAAYTSVDGLPCSGAPAILNGILREELGFDGMVVSDYFGIKQLIEKQCTAADKQAAGVQAICGGVDVELPDLDCFGAPLRGALEEGQVGRDLLDAAVARVLAAKIRLGLFEDPFVDAGAAPSRFGTSEQRALARRAAARSVVLLRNEGGVLPLGRDVGAVAVIGPGADNARLLQGDYHYPTHRGILPGDEIGRSGGADADACPALDPAVALASHITPLAAFQEALGARTTVLFAAGCDVTGSDRSGFDQAVRAAKRADVVVVVAAGRSGLGRSSTVGEARDASDLRLTGVQLELVRAVRGTGTPTVVVVLSGRVHALADLVNVADALVQLWPPGEQGGRALVDVLIGDVDPGGRLPVSLPRSAGHVPSYAAPRRPGGRSFFYDDYTDSSAGPLFSFGHGLSYTTISYGDLQVDADTTTDAIEARVTVTNTGQRAGDEVVQLYVTDSVASVARPEHRLVSFSRIALEPGERRLVGFELHPSNLAFYDQEMRFVCEPGEYVFHVGLPGSDRKHASVYLVGPTAQFRQRDTVAPRTFIE